MGFNRFCNLDCPDSGDPRPSSSKKKTTESLCYVSFRWNVSACSAFGSGLDANINFLEPAVSVSLDTAFYFTDWTMSPVSFHS